MQAGPWDFVAKGYSKIPNAVIHSPAALSLTPHAYIVLIQVVGILEAVTRGGRDPVNTISLVWSNGKYPMARGTFSGALQDLERHGFIAAVNRKVGRYRWDTAWVGYFLEAEESERLGRIRMRQTAQRERTIQHRQYLLKGPTPKTTHYQRSSVREASTAFPVSRSGHTVSTAVDSTASARSTDEHNAHPTSTLQENIIKDLARTRARRDQDSHAPVRIGQVLAAANYDSDSTGPMMYELARRIMAVVRKPEWHSWFVNSLRNLHAKGGDVVRFEKDLELAETNAGLRVSEIATTNIKHPARFLVHRMIKYCKDVNCNWPDFPRESQEDDPLKTASPASAHLERYWSLRKARPDLSNGEIAEIMYAEDESNNE